MIRCSARRVFLAAVLLFAAVPAVHGQDPNDVDALLQRAMELHKAGDLMGAIQNYQVALESAPERGDIRSNLGAAYVGLGRFTEGIDEYRKALASREDPRVRLNLALALYKSGRIPEAVPEFERVVQQDQHNKQAMLLLSDCLSQLGRDKDVVALLGPREPEFGEDDLAYAYLLGNALLQTDEVDRGQVLIDRIFKKGDSAEAHVMLGTAYMSKRDYLNAVKELERALQMNPDLPSVNAAYGRALLNTGDREKATQAFRRELEINPNNFDANLQLGNLYRLEQRHDDALVYLKRAEAAQPTNPAVRHGLAAAYLALNEPEKSRELLEAAVRDTPSFADAHVLLATTYYRLRRKEDGDRQREIVGQLTAEAQAKQPGARAADAAAEGAAAPKAPPSPQRR